MNKLSKQQAWRDATACLLQASVADARWQAELLLRGALDEPRANFLASLQDPVPAAVLERFRQWVEQRCHGTPVQYLLGRQEFMGLPLEVTPAVLIPRPDTEILAEAALRLAAACPAPLILDLATGSGAIALALAAGLPTAQIWATDISPDALKVAAANAERLSLGARISWRLGDWTAPLPADLLFDLIVSNPPYIPSDVIAQLSPDVQREPRLALDGGPDGLDCYRRLIPLAVERLRHGGCLLLEVGQGQAAAVARLLEQAGLRDGRTVKDLAGIERVVIATRASDVLNEVNFFGEGY